MGSTRLKTIGDVEQELEAHENAIIQLEQDKDAFVRQVSDKLNIARMTAYGEDGDYRGLFGDEDEARAFGMFVLSRQKDPREAERFRTMLERSYPTIVRDMSSEVDDSGGSLIAPAFSERLKRLVERFGVFMRDAFPMPMGNSDTLSFPKQVGEVEVFLLSEGKAGPSSEPKLQQVSLNAKEWGVLTYTPRSLREDSIVAVAELVMRSIVFAFARKADKIGFNGDGSADYFGVKGIIPKLKEIYGVTGGKGLVLGSGDAGDGWSGLELADFTKVQGQLPEFDGQVAPKWYTSRPFYFNVMVPLILAAGGVTAEEIEGRRQRTFLGDPVELVQTLPREGGNSQVPCVYGDLRQAATVGRRREVTIEESADYKFAERLITTLGTARIAISVEDVGSESEAGPIVGLITPAAA